MSKLLSANFIRLWKERVFLIAIAGVFTLGAVIPISIKIAEIRLGVFNSIDPVFGQFAMFIGIVLAIFCSFFVGKEYCDGTIRNKIICGKKRTDIYLANFITCTAVSLMLCIAFFLPYLGIGIPLLGSFHMEKEIVFWLFLTVTFLSIAFASIYNLIAMLSTSKAVTASVCILLAFLFLYMGFQLKGMLEQPEIIDGTAYDENGVAYQEVEDFPNPEYLQGGERQVVRFLCNLIPGGQVAQCVGRGSAGELSELPVYSLGVILITTGIGVFVFRKKDLK
ncbi:MAG: ABC transporter permease subunit [Lachnospiraceae bacterium]|nr:ABC transporter permease subunit [Lachnospiraceae bacterium]